MLNLDEFCFLSRLTMGAAGLALIFVSWVCGGWASDVCFAAVLCDPFDLTNEEKPL
jgi:hypothetical protein